jgi:hypothetical protein
VQKSANRSEVSKEEFRALLERRKDAAGSVFQLSLQIGVHPRRIACWRAGQGPAPNKRLEIYAKLKNM